MIPDLNTEQQTGGSGDSNKSHLVDYKQPASRKHHKPMIQCKGTVHHITLTLDYVNPGLE